MSKKPKPQKITFRSIFRLIIFLVILFLVILFLDQQNRHGETIDDPTLIIGESLEQGDVLGEIYSKLPQDSRNQMENFDQTEVGIFLNNSFQSLQQKLDGFPQKQIKEIKKAVIKNISDDMIRNIDEN